MMSAREYRTRAAQASELADSISDDILKAQLMSASLDWGALAATADWQDAMEARISGRRNGV
jgi:hypothetical protein